MKFRFHLFIFILFLTAVQAQVKEIQLPTNLGHISNVYHYNTRNKNFFFLKASKRLEVIQTTNDLTVEHTLSRIVPYIPIDPIVSFTANEENKVTMYTTNNQKIEARTFDFTENKTTVASPFTWNSKKEDSFLQFSHADKLYVLHSKIDTNQLRFLQLNSDLEPQKDTILNFTGFNFYLNSGSQVSLNSALRDSVPMTYIEMNQPTDLLKAAAQRKYYIHNDILYITLDTSNQSTEILSIDLNTQKTTYTSYPQPFNKPNLKHPGSNSMLFDNKLVQAYFDKQFISILIRDENGEPLKSFQLTKDNTDFLTGDMVMIRNVRGIFKDKYTSLPTSQFLLSAKNSNLHGIITYSIGDHIVMQFGAANRNKPLARNFFFDVFINGSSTNMFNPYFKSIVVLASTALNQKLEPDFDFEIPKEDKLLALRSKRGFRITSNKYKLVFTIGDQPFYGKQESGSKTLDLVPF